MILLAAASFLLFFITYFLGAFFITVLEKWFGIPLQTDFLGRFFLGLAVSFIYFNLLSLFTAIDYKVLAPLLLISVFHFSKSAIWESFFSGIKQIISLLFQKQNWLITAPILLILAMFWVVPPGNWDSGEYHYLSIRWYEKFAVVPGLANLHARLSFNAANFIISSAYSFTDIIGQSIYPLNGVIELLFYVWLLRKMFLQTSSGIKLVFFVFALLVFRDTVINISSPSSDLLVVLLIYYCAITTYELLISKTLTLNTGWIVIVINVFSVCAKLSAIPTLLLSLFIIYRTYQKSSYVVFKIGLLLACLVLPWLARNVIMSGYLLYPVGITRFFSFDWSVPKEVMMLDAFYTKYGPVDPGQTDKIGSFPWYRLVERWFIHNEKDNIKSLITALVAFTMPPIVFLSRWKNEKRNAIGLLAGIYYLAAIIWLLYSPEFRFGLCLLHILVVLGCMQFANRPSLPSFKYLPALQFLILAFVFIHFFYDLKSRPSSQFSSFKSTWLYPLKDSRYTENAGSANGFPYVLLNNGQRLYLSDDTHHCMNAPMPCMSWRYGEIEMRGTTLQQGFRNIRNDVRKNFPFLPQ
jgi:hypothetical protein